MTTIVEHGRDGIGETAELQPENYGAIGIAMTDGRRIVSEHVERLDVPAWRTVLSRSPIGGAPDVWAPHRRRPCGHK
jgi:hypothetical protein